jgi:hypothetical protein
MFIQSGDEVLADGVNGLLWSGGLDEVSQGRRVISNSRLIQGSWVPQMSVRVAGIATLGAVRHPEHGISHRVVDVLPVHLDVQVETQEMTHNDQLRSDQLHDRRRSHRAAVWAPNLGVGSSFHHSDDKVTWLIVPPGQRLKLRQHALLRNWRDPGTALLRNWRDPKVHSSGIGGIQSRAKDCPVS